MCDRCCIVYHSFRTAWRPQFVSGRGHVNMTSWCTLGKPGGRCVEGFVGCAMLLPASFGCQLRLTAAGTGVAGTIGLRYFMTCVAHHFQ